MRYFFFFFLFRLVSYNLASFLLNPLVKYGYDVIYFSENIDINSNFSLLFFESRFLIYYHIPNFVTL